MLTDFLSGRQMDRQASEQIDRPKDRRHFNR